MAVLRGTSAAAGVAYYDGEGLVDAGAVTVTVTRGDGRTVATNAAAVAGSETGRYTYTLTSAVTAEVERFTLTWTSAAQGVRVTQVEVVGGHLIELADLRREAALQSAAKFPLDELQTERDAFTAMAQRYCGVAFNPTYEVASGLVGTAFTLPSRDIRRLLSVSVDGAAAATDVTGWDHTGWGRVTRPGYLQGVAVVAYEHGMDVTPPDVREAAILAVRERLLSNQAGRPNRVYMQSDDLGNTQRLSTPGPTRLTGMIDVDAVFERYRLTGALVG